MKNPTPTSSEQCFSQDDQTPYQQSIGISNEDSQTVRNSPLNPVNIIGEIFDQLGIQVQELQTNQEIEPSTAFNNKTGKDIEHIKETLLLMWDKIQEISKEVQSLTNMFYRPIAAGGKLYNFPINTNEDLKEFDTKLGTDESFFNKIVSIFLIKTFNNFYL